MNEKSRTEIRKAITIGAVKNQRMVYTSIVNW